ncbi:hypothetical protein GCM10009119_04270 [Algoriphagus jejuensis]|uniref:Ketosteroid isomerase-like protein n=1 Tax=Algoriphagus jejuensis TaxID=419934 RepID=A0ABP3Y7B7_9BACT
MTAISVVLFAGSCNTKPSTGESQAITPTFNLETAKAEIEDANRRFMTVLANGDSIGIANSYTSGAKVMFAGAPSHVGKAAIQTKFSQIINSGVTKVELKTTEVFGSEALLAKGAEVTVYVSDIAVGEEKYIILWKEEDGKWKLFRDIALQFRIKIPIQAQKMSSQFS